MVLATLLERAIFLWFRSSIHAEAFLAQIAKLLRAGNTDRAVKLCAVAPTVPLAAMVRAGLERAGAGVSAARTAMQAAIAAAAPGLRRRLNALLASGAVALALGWFGSQQLGGSTLAASAGPPPLPFGQPMSMAPAMAGLAVAIVAGLGWLAFTLKARSLLAQLEEARTRLERLLGELGES
jgi:biopolymer transport protein ExbB/TolQ